MEKTEQNNQASSFVRPQKAQARNNNRPEWMKENIDVVGYLNNDMSTDTEEKFAVRTKSQSFEKTRKHFTSIIHVSDCA